MTASPTLNRNAVSTGRSSLTRRWPELVVSLSLATLAASGSWIASGRLHPGLFTEQGYDVWFDADIPRVYDSMTDRMRRHYRTNVHPLFPLASYPPVTVLHDYFGVPRLAAARGLTAAVASLWVAALYALLRWICDRRLDAVVFTLLGGASAAAVFWLTVPETYAWGSLSILLALGVVAWAERGQARERWFIAASALTLSFTLTNWMTGLIAALVGRPWRRALQISVNAFCIVVALWGVQRFFFPLCDFFLQPGREAGSLLQPEAGGPVSIGRAFFLHSMILPEISRRDEAREPLSVQASQVRSSGIVGCLGIGLWLLLVVAGLHGLFFGAAQSRIRLVLGLTLVGQLGLHLLYGRETFLYSLHFAPLLVALAAFSTRTRLRRPALAIAVALTLAAGINNVCQFKKATEMIRPQYTFINSASGK